MNLRVIGKTGAQAERLLPLATIAAADPGPASGVPFKTSIIAEHQALRPTQNPAPSGPSPTLR